jgi:preprotein translocase subunit SecA
MSDAAALLKHRPVELFDGAYLERAEIREHAFEELLKGVLARVPSLSRQGNRIRRFVAAAGAHETEIKALETAQLAEALREACRPMRTKGFDDTSTARAFAVVREASRRTLGMRHHDVQLIGGWALLQGKIAEMETGEGKTLVATLAAATAAAAGAAVHVVTVNDYLAGRDAESNAPLYSCLELTVGAIAQGMTPDQRRLQYARDITHVSNKEIVFDYLKDRLATGGVPRARLRLRRIYKESRSSPVLLRGLHVAIVDEADSVLIDEARTPLILSETLSAGQNDKVFHEAVALGRRMQLGEHFTLNAQRDIWVTPAGKRLAEDAAASLGGLWLSAVWREELIQKALSALWCFQRDQHYIVADGKVQIVDENTGRVMPDRSWERGLHQMIEAKEGCEFTGERRTLSRMTYQRFFRRYLLLSGMTGTGAEVRAELCHVYELGVLKIPTHRPSKRRQLGTRCWKLAEARWNAVAQRAIELSESGRPVLIGTRSVEASEILGARFRDLNAAHRVLNARQDQEEANIISVAGHQGSITVATNMAGRGTDIRLAEGVRELGGLHVILTEFHETPRIDRQLFGRCARQGEPGSVETMISLEDDLFARHAATLRGVCLGAARAGMLSTWIAAALVRLAQRAAEKHNARIRMDTLKQDRKLQTTLAFAGDPN